MPVFHLPEPGHEVKPGVEAIGHLPDVEPVGAGTESHGRQPADVHVRRRSLDAEERLVEGEHPR